MNNRKLAAAAACTAAVYVVGVAIFERLAPVKWVRAWQRFNNSFTVKSAGVVPGWAVIETTGRTSGLRRHTPVGGRLSGDTYWVVAGERHRSNYVKNLEANPTVRVRVHGRWRDGVARVLPNDNPRRMLMQSNPLNGLFIAIAGKDKATIRIDLGPQP